MPVFHKEPSYLLFQTLLNNEEEDITNHLAVALATAGASAILNTKDGAASLTDPMEGSLHNPLMK